MKSQTMKYQTWLVKVIEKYFPIKSLSIARMPIKMCPSLNRSSYENSFSDIFEGAKSFKLHIYFYFCGVGGVSFFFQLPLVRRQPFQIQILLYTVVKLLFLVVIYSGSRSLFVLFMDDLTRAVAPFLPGSGGIHEGGFSQPPTPTPPPDNSGLGLIPGAQNEGDLPNSYPSGSSQEAHQEDQPGSSHLAPHQGEVGQKKLISILERHLRRHCASQAVVQKYPHFKDFTQEDLTYFAKNIAISQLDIDSKTDMEIGSLAEYIRNYKTMKTLLNLFFESYYGND